MTEVPPQLVAFEHALIGAAHRDVRGARRRLLIALAAVLVFAGGSAVAADSLLGISALDDPSTPAAPAAIVSAFRTLGMPAPGDTLPTSVPVDARSLGRGIYIAERDGALCIYVVDGDAQCGRRFIDSIVLTGGMLRPADTPSTPFEIEAAGVALDGVSAVRIVTVSGATTTLPVTTNGFRGTVPDAGFADVSAIEIVHDDGTLVRADPAVFGWFTP